MAVTQTDHKNTDGTITSYSTAGANEEVTVTIPDGGDGNKARIHKVTASASVAAVAADTALAIKPDGSTVSWKEALAAARGPLADRDFKQPIVCKDSTAAIVSLAAPGGTSVGHLSVVYDYRG